MTTTTIETLQQEYERLSDQQDLLRTQVRNAGGATLEQKDRSRAIARRLREILAIPPAGYALPKAAADLLAHAEAHGWDTAVRWTPPGWEDAVSVRVGVRREMTIAEKKAAAYCRSGAWLYELTYHSRDCPAGKVKRFGAGRGCTPDMAQAEYPPAPSLKAIRAVITANPAPQAVA
ncbi:hypothetical protein [Streptomyces olivaceiscleroticus]|uniref:Uncharacterized protein n=1 Tax=Streptomyces olivaceiscleroticus TaxID=68245 RepID=A0ABP3LIG8_9ACTN